MFFLLKGCAYLPDHLKSTPTVLLINLLILIIFYEV